jgi:hypothetical protein
VIQKSFTLFQIVSYGTMDLAPLLYVSRAMEQSLLLLIWGLLLVIPKIPAVSTISSICWVGLLIVMFLHRGHLAMWFKESSLGLRGLNAYVSDCKQIEHYFGLSHGDLLNSLDITHLVVKDIDDLDVLDVQDSAPGIAEMFHVVPEALIMLLLYSL